MRKFSDFRRPLTETPLEVSKIHDPQGVLSDEGVEKYRGDIRAGKKIKPAIVLRLNKRMQKKTGKTHVLWDGTHRYHAHRLEGKTHMEVDHADSVSRAMDIEVRRGYDR